MHAAADAAGAPELALGVLRLDLRMAAADERGQLPLSILDVLEPQLVLAAHLARFKGRARVGVGVGVRGWG